MRALHFTVNAARFTVNLDRAYIYIPFLSIMSGTQIAVAHTL